MTSTTYYVVDVHGSYYTGEMYAGSPVTTGDKSRALEMTDEDIQEHFPKGLPADWKKVPV